LPFTLFVLYKASKGWKYTSIIAITGIIISVFISQTRSAWLATLIIILLSLVLVTIFSKPERKKWIIGSLIGIISIAAIVALILATDKEGSLSRSVKERTISMAQPAADSSAGAENIKDRLHIWSKTIELIKAHAILGVGPGNWKVAIPAYGTEGLAWSYGFYTPDRPHNVYLQIASETGIPGALLYFGMWILIAIIGFRIILKTQSQEKRILVILMLAGLAAFASDCMFSFPAERIEHSLYVTLMGGIILGCYGTISAAENVKKQQISKQILTALILLAVFNLFLGIKKQNFEVHMNKAKSYEKANLYQDVIDEVEAGRSAFVTIDPIAKPLEMYSAIAYKELKNYKRAIEEINIAKRYNPNCSQTYINMGTIYTDMNQYDTAIKCYLQSLKLTPHYDITLKNLAVNYFQVRNYAACIETIGKINIEGDQYFAGMLKEAKSQLALQSPGQNK
jgi:energy-coupling factor transporter transmembrane protein EcfT